MGAEELTLHSSRNVPEIPEKVAPEYIMKKVREHVEDGKSTFIIDGVTEEQYTYEEFEVITQNIASALYKRGFRKGDTLIYLTFDMVKLAIVYTGVWRCNGIMRSSYPEDTPETLLERVEESRVGWLYCDENQVEMCLSVAEKIYWDVEIIVAGKVDEGNGVVSIFDLMLDDGAEMPEPDLSEDDTALILCTSGTTGASKGAAINHSAVIFQIQVATSLPFPKEEPSIFISKGTHITGTMFPLAMACHGGTTIVMATINKVNIFRSIDTFRPEVIFGFPTILLLLVLDPEARGYDFSSLKVALAGGAPVTPQISKAVTNLSSIRAVLNCYGLTEVLTVGSHFNIEDPDQLTMPDCPLSSIGKLFPGVALQVRDTETDEILPANSNGELCVKCRGVFSHYLNHPEATKKAFTSDGFFKTGDLGYYDDNGFIYIVDRAKEIFKYIGNHVSPTEIEKAISDHPAVGEVCVIGVPDPNGAGHIPRAFVILKAGVQCTSDELIHFANEKLADYKHIRGGLYFVTDLPKGKTGKITRHLVEKLVVPDS